MKDTQQRAHPLQDLLYFRGRVALCAILKALGVGDGSEVATQAFTCVAVPEAITASGAKPVYIDVQPSGFNMDVRDLERNITSRTRAIVVQHTYGIPAEMSRIMEVAKEAGIPVVEDCCHTLVSTYRGRQVGSFGVASFYSFEWGKPIVVGIGGSARVNDMELERRMRAAYARYQFPDWLTQLRIQLQFLAFTILYRPSLYWSVRSLFHRLGSLGVAESNYNPVEQADIAQDFTLKMPRSLQRRLARKLQDIDQQTAHARWAADQYRARIECDAVTHPRLPAECDTLFARYPLIAEGKPGLLAAARQANVELAGWYSTPVHPLSEDELALVGYSPGSCPNAEARCQRVVTLPTHQRVGRRDVDRAIRFLNSSSASG